MSIARFFCPRASFSTHSKRILAFTLVATVLVGLLGTWGGPAQAASLPHVVAPAPAGGSGAGTYFPVPGTVRLTPITAYGSQRTLDRCKLVLWDNSPRIVAGHDWCGFSYFARLPVGKKVTVTTGSARGTYQVYAVRVTHLKAGARYPSYLYRADLVLQTCVGNGTGFALAKRMA